MASPAGKPATYEDLLRLPDDRIGEIVDGVLYASPRPGLPHAVTHSTLTGELHPSRSGGGAGGWWILIEPELQLNADVLVDAVVRAEPFETIEIDLLHLWGEERPSPAG